MRQTFIVHRIHMALACGLLLCCSMALAESPESRYKAYLTAIANATTLQDVFPYLAEAKRKTIEEGLKKAEEKGADTAQIESRTLSVLRLAAAAGQARYEEMIIDNEASLVVERGEFTVQGLMIMEDGDWRIADERMLKIPNY